MTLLLHFDWTNEGLLFVLLVAAILLFGSVVARSKGASNVYGNRTERRRERALGRRRQRP